MTNSHVLEKPAIRAKIIAWVLEGKTDPEIASLITVRGRAPVTRQAVCKFRQRHKAELTTVIAEVERQVTDYAIANVVSRIRDAQLRRDLLARVQELRAAGGDGMETGIVAKQYKSIGSGPFAQVVEEFKVDTAFLAEWRANEDHVAVQLGQLDKTATQVNVGVLVRYVQGPD